MGLWSLWGSDYGWVVARPFLAFRLLAGLEVRREEAFRSKANWQQFWNTQREAIPVALFLLILQISLYEGR